MRYSQAFFIRLVNLMVSDGEHDLNMVFQIKERLDLHMFNLFVHNMYFK